MSATEPVASFDTWCLKQSPLWGHPLKLPAPRAGDSKSGSRIRCPHCSWTPRRQDLWRCVCGHAWNTFETRGVCPACSFQWIETQCLRCIQWSRHDDWYVLEDGSGGPG
jgi:hypothetical protein